MLGSAACGSHCIILEGAGSNGAISVTDPKKNHQESHLAVIFGITNWISSESLFSSVLEFWNCLWAPFRRKKSQAESKFPFCSIVPKWSMKLRTLLTCQWTCYVSAASLKIQSQEHQISAALNSDNMYLTYYDYSDTKQYITTMNLINSSMIGA